ncbi:MAG TPA: DUF1499 domain-containing protein [Xanthobacteraceae bacterium]
MIRSRLPEEPLSRLAVWSRRVAVFSIPVVLLAVTIVRSGLLELVPALATFGGALALALVAILLALGAFIVIWREGLRGGGHAILALLIGIGILAYPAYLGTRAYRLPVINDVTTDPIDPPRFEAIARLRSRESNPITYAGLRAAELQRGAYPDIEPLLLNVTPQEAYDAALAVITRRKWRIVDARPPQPGRRDGLIEAVARTPIMGFRDDVALRIRPAREGARVDIRSASRYGRSDLGANASRVRALIEDIDDAAGTEEQKTKKAAPAKAPPPKKAQAPTRR